MIRLRVSTVEAFRRVARTAYGDEAELVERLRLGQWAGGPSDWRMDAGTAWHKLLALEHVPGVREAMCQAKRDKGNTYPTEEVAGVVATEMSNATSQFIEPFHCANCRQWHVGKPTGAEERMGRVRCGEYSFDRSAWLDAKAHVGPGLCEVTGRKTWDVGGLAVEVEGTADLVRGLSIQDHKAKFSAIDAGDYEASLQWRFYLAIHEARWFRYNLFAFKDPRDGYCELRDIASFRFWPYHGMLAYCRSWLVRFVDWADGRGLLPGLVVQPPRESAA